MLVVCLLHSVALLFGKACFLHDFTWSVPISPDVCLTFEDAVRDKSESSPNREQASLNCREVISRPCLFPLPIGGSHNKHDSRHVVSSLGVGAERGGMEGKLLGIKERTHFAPPSLLICVFAPAVPKFRAEHTTV